nr:hypothetical protein Iba_chr13bCG11600 [Ipomoea batatas]
MAANNRYYSKRELTEIGMEGFALIDEFYGGGRKHKTLPNYVYSSYKATYGPYRQSPPPPAATSVIAGNRFTKAGSSGGVSGKAQNCCSYRYPPPQSLVCYAPAVAATAETVTVIRRYDEEGKFSRAI